MSWTLGDLLPLDITIEEAEDNLTVVTIGTPAGPIRIIASIAEVAGTLMLDGAHIEGPGANVIGPGNIRTLAHALMETLDYAAIDIQGAGRTTGARPSEEHRPRFRFTRRAPSDH